MQGAEGGEAVTAPLLVLISTARVLVSTARVLCIFRDLKEERQALFHSDHQTEEGTDLLPVNRHNQNLGAQHVLCSGFSLESDQE